MNQVSSSSHGATIGALVMVTAAVLFGGSNVLQSVLPTPTDYGGFGLSSTGMAFWQYVIASVLALPLILRIGLGKLRTRHPLVHQLRALASAVGVHVFVYGFASGVPIWQMVTLLATGPLFIILGSTLFLGEKATPVRLVAALMGFAGAVIVSGVGGDLGAVTLIPVAAAALWAMTDVLTKYLAREEAPETLTISLLVLMTPNHLLVLLAVNAWAWLLPSLSPEGLASGFPFALPSGTGLWLLLLLGLLTAAAQYLLGIAYKFADATYLQPFADLKVPLGGLLGWLALGQVPSIWFWPGAMLVLGGSLLVFWAEAEKRPRLHMA